MQFPSRRGSTFDDVCVIDRLLAVVQTLSTPALLLKLLNCYRCADCCCVPCHWHGADTED